MERWQAWLDKSQLLDSKRPALRRVKVWDRQSQMRSGVVNRDGVVVWGKTVSYWQDYWPHMLMPPTWVISYRFAWLRFVVRIPFGNRRKPMWMRGRDPWRFGIIPIATDAPDREHAPAFVWAHHAGNLKAAIRGPSP